MKKLVLSFLMLFLIISIADCNTIYVKENGGVTPDGTTWENAFATLNEALSAASNGDDIWVARGIYYPTGSTDRNISFVLKTGVSMFGGFKVGDNNLDYRVEFEDGETNQTILSGDIGTVDDITDNSYQIVDATSISANGLVFDGFVVTNGNGDDSTDGVGISVTGNITINNCTIKNCVSAVKGGGIYFASGISLVQNSYIKNCTAQLGGGIYQASEATLSLDKCYVMSNESKSNGNGGGIHAEGQCGITNSQLINNISGGSGGGIFISTTDLIISNSLIANNSALGGSAIFSQEGNCEITNNLIVNNSATSTANNGGSLFFLATGTSILTNNTIANNTAAAVDYGGGVVDMAFAKVILLNNIFWQNGINVYGQMPDITIGYCYVDGGSGAINTLGGALTYIGNNNEFSETCVYGADGEINFVSPTTSQGLNPTSPAYNDANWALDAGSVCTNAGTPTSNPTNEVFPCFYDYEVYYDATNSVNIPETCTNGFKRLDDTIDIGAIESGAVITANKIIPEATLNTYVLNNTICINTQLAGTVNIYNLSGKLVYSNSIKEGTSLVYTPSTAGIFVVTLKNSGSYLTAKVNVR